jgi:phosphopantothenoylcysteine decarboxylase/phosphopantothenate--cysteine ligase
MTSAAEQFVTPLTLQTVSGRKVGRALFDLTDESEIGHIRVADQADLLLIAPASADFVARLAAGMADDLLSTVALATRAPVLLAPAMNVNMWENPLTQANLGKLLARTAPAPVTTVGPDRGPLACGWIGTGRMIDPEIIVAEAARLLAPGDLQGLRVVVTAGPTFEAIDDVRFIGNRSSGKMGFALARDAARRGADVTLIAANVTLDSPPGVRMLPVGTAAELAQACEREFDTCDVLLMAAAVADFRPDSPVGHKLKKDQGTPTIELEPTEDVLSALAARRRERQLLVGFAAEHGEGAVQYGRGKLERKRLDAVVVNDVSTPGVGFDSSDNEVTILTAGGGVRQVPRASKESVARAVLDEIERLRSEREEADGARADARSAARV